MKSMLRKEIIDRFLQGKLTSEELQKLRYTVNEDKHSFFDHLSSDWEMPDSATGTPKWSAKKWEELRVKLGVAPSKEQASNVFRLRWWLKAAATLLLVVSAWFLLRPDQESALGGMDAPSLITEVNDSNVSVTVLLADGTKVILTPQSTLSYYENFNERYRVVRLEGEAFFKTDRRDERPFIVISENITSICRGNEFSIAAHRDSDEIMVTSANGKIEVAQNDRLNSERNKVSVESCERYSFNKKSHEHLVGQIANCDYEKNKQSYLDSVAKSVVML